MKFLCISRSLMPHARELVRPLSHFLLLALFSLVLTGCVIPYSPYPKEEARLRSTSPPSTLWQLPAPSAARDAFTSLTFAADADHLIAGSAAGHITLWQVGATSPARDIADETDCIAALALSPNGTTLISAMLHPADIAHPWAGTTDSALLIHARELATGKLLATASDNGNDPLIQFHPTGRFVAITTARGRFFLHNAQSLATIFSAQNDLEPDYDFRTPSQPAFFRSDSADPIDVIAIARHWQISGNQSRSLQNYPDQPDALAVPSATAAKAYFAERTYTNDSFLHFQVYHRRNPGVVLAPIDRSDIDAYFSLEGNLTFSQLLAIPSPSPAPNKHGRLVLVSNKGILLADLDQATCSWLRKDSSDKPTFRIALSPDNRRIAACGPWGLAVWQMPDRK